MSKILIIVDVQNDFCENGSLAVRGSNEIFPLINTLKKSALFSQVILTMDWHPQSHVSFASTHGREPFTSIEVNGEQQELWPDHCVAHSYGAQLSPLLELSGKEIYIKKGQLEHRDSYSGFQADHNNTIQLNELLNQSKAEQVYICGLAFDFCVGKTALDSASFGFKTLVIVDATRSVSQQTADKMQVQLKAKKVQLTTSKQLL